jgi:hypothetical protein
MTMANINKAVALFLAILLVLVAIPLTIITITTNGGTLGFGIMGLPILLPLCTYLFTTVVPFVKGRKQQRILFITSQIITLVTGLASFFIFPIFPILILAIPVVLGIVDILDKSRQQYYLLLMLVLPSIANVILLIWEFDFGRTFPLFQLL